MSPIEAAEAGGAAIFIALNESNLDFRTAVARLASTPPAALAALASDMDAGVRVWVARNASTRPSDPDQLPETNR